MKRLDRLVVGTFLKLFASFALTAPLLFILGDITDKLDNYLALGVTWREAAQAYVLQYPHFMYWSFPVAAMVAVVFTVHGMTANREVMAAKAGGVSFRRLVFPLFVVGAILSGVGWGLSEVAPRFNRWAGELLRGSQGISPGDRRDTFVFKDGREVALSARFLTVSTGFLDDPRLEVIDATGPTLDIVSDRATYSPDGWTFFEGMSRSPGPGIDDIRQFRFEELLVREIQVTPEQLQQRQLDDMEMTREELTVAHRNLLGAGVGATNQAREYLVERELRWALAAAALVIIIFGAPLATSVRRGGTAFGVGVSLGATIVYMLLLRLAKAFGTIDLIDPLPAAWTPNAIFLAVGILLMLRVRT